MTSRERQTAAYKCQEPDRVPISVRGVDPDSGALLRKHESYRPLVDAVREKGDIELRWPVSGKFMTAWLDDGKISRHVAERGEDFELHETVIQTPTGELVSRETVSRKGEPGLAAKFYVEDRDDVSKFLSIPYEPHQPDMAGFFRTAQNLGERGIVLVSVGEPALLVHELLGSERLAMWSVEERDLVHELFELFTQRICDRVKYLLGEGVGPFFSISGPELVAPPLHSPRDFYEFVVAYDKRILDLIHDADGLVHVHCHGSIGKCIEGFAEMGANCLHPVEAPPLGDIELAEAKRRVGHRVCLQGNIQIGDLYTLSAEQIREQTINAIRDAGQGGGFMLCPTASPYMPVLTDQVRDNYLAMIETAWEYGTYPLRLN